MQKLAHGAEAVLYKDKGKIIKERVSKGYRIKALDDKLRKERTKTEARILHKLQRAGINVPRVLKVSETVLELEDIGTNRVRDYLDKSPDASVFKEVAEQVSLMHKAGIAHGDLTTSNMILSGDKLYLIDFGLAEHSDKTEDKAVDLHLLKECLKSKHFPIWEKCWDTFEKAYGSKEVLERLKVVEKRGRYKEKGPV
jgi:Kae1-associated kinase Bud32